MKRPASILVFGILNILLSIVGGIALLGGLTAMALTPAGVDNPVLQVLRENPTYAAWVKLVIPLGLLGHLVLLAAGVGLLCSKGWGRVLAIIYGIYSLARGLISLGLNLILLVAPLVEQTDKPHGATMALGVALVGTAIRSLSLIYAVLLLIFMTRPKVILFFQTQGQMPELRES